MQALLIAIAGVSLGTGILVLGSSLNHRGFSRIYSLLILVPAFHIAADTFLDQSRNNLSLLIALSGILTGSLLIMLGEPKHPHEHLYTTKQAISPHKKNSLLN